jgi:hypothetical protein
LSLGAAFVLLYLIKNFVQGKAYKIVTVVMISIFCIYNFNFYLNFARYNLKNKSIMFNLENFDIIKNNQTFLIKDKTEKYMITERSEHEYIGMLNILYGGNSRLAVLNEKDIPVFAKFKEFSFYGIQNYVLEDKPDYIIEISDNDERQELINQRYMLKNILYNLNRKNRFKENTTRLIKVNFIKYDT